MKSMRYIGALLVAASVVLWGGNALAQDPAWYDDPFEGCWGFKAKWTDVGHPDEYCVYADCDPDAQTECEGLEDDDDISVAVNGETVTVTVWNWFIKENRKHLRIRAIGTGATPDEPPTNVAVTGDNDPPLPDSGVEIVSETATTDAEGNWVVEVHVIIEPQPDRDVLRFEVPGLDAVGDVGEVWAWSDCGRLAEYECDGCVFEAWWPYDPEKPPHCDYVTCSSEAQAECLAPPLEGKFTVEKVDVGGGSWEFTVTVWNYFIKDQYKDVHIHVTGTGATARPTIIGVTGDNDDPIPDSGVEMVDQYTGSAEGEWVVNIMARIIPQPDRVILRFRVPGAPAAATNASVWECCRPRQCDGCLFEARWEPAQQYPPTCGYSACSSAAQAECLALPPDGDITVGEVDLGGGNWEFTVRIWNYFIKERFKVVHIHVTGTGATADPVIVGVTGDSDDPIPDSAVEMISQYVINEEGNWTVNITARIIPQPDWVIVKFRVSGAAAAATSASVWECCPGRTDIPAMTEWGVVVMVLLICAAGTVVFLRRRAMTARA